METPNFAELLPDTGQADTVRMESTIAFESGKNETPLLWPNTQQENSRKQRQLVEIDSLADPFPLKDRMFSYEGNDEGNIFRVFNEDKFQHLLQELDDELVKSDIVQLKFLCRESLSGQDYSKITRGIDLFYKLKKKREIGHENLFLLGELLYKIGRKDLLKLLVVDVKQYEQFLRRVPERISRYSSLLHEICEETVSRDLESMKFYMCQNFSTSKAKMVSVKEPQELFLMMEKKNLLDENNLDSLRKMMVATQNEDMVDRIDTFRGAALPGNPPSLDVWNSQNKPVVSRGLESNVYAAGDHRTGLPFDQPDYERLRYCNQEQHSERRHQSVVQVMEIDPSIQLSMFEDDLPSYKMNANPRGICVIINNVNFYKDPTDNNSRELKTREGSDVDRQNLEYIFTKLNFKVEVHQDLTAQKLVSSLNQYALNTNHERYDCFACCILTHGRNQQLYGCDGRLVDVMEVTNFFKSGLCTSLRGKPKLFFIQACQGREKQAGFTQRTNDLQMDNAGNEGEMRETVPNEADFLIAFATLPGFVSYRSRTSGSWFVNALVENLEKYGAKYDLLSIMIKVNEEVSKMDADMPDGKYKQVPLPHPTLRKRIYFK